MKPDLSRAVRAVVLVYADDGTCVGIDGSVSSHTKWIVDGNPWTGERPPVEEVREAVHRAHETGGLLPWSPLPGQKIWTIEEPARYVCHVCDVEFTEWQQTRFPDGRWGYMHTGNGGGESHIVQEVREPTCTGP